MNVLKINCVEKKLSGFIIFLSSLCQPSNIDNSAVDDDTHSLKLGQGYFQQDSKENHTGREVFHIPFFISYAY